MKGAGVLAVAGSILVVSLPAFAAGEGAREGAVMAALTATKIVGGKDASNALREVSGGSLWSALGCA